MPTPEKCPLCEGTVAEGALIDHRHDGVKGFVTWYDGVPRAGLFWGLKIRRDELRDVRGYRCTKCGYLMLFAR